LRSTASVRSPLIIFHGVMLSGLEYEESPFDIGDNGVGRQPALLQPSYRSVTSSRGEDCARPDHPRARARVGQWLFDHYPVDHQQSWGFGRALRRGAIWYRPEKPERDGKISHQAEPGSFLHGLPRTLERAQAEDHVLLQGDLD